MIGSVVLNQPSLSFQSRKANKLDREHTVAILGTGSDINATQKYRKMAYEVSNQLAKDGYNIITGGGNGVMAAANKGASDANPDKSFSIQVKHWLNKQGEKFFNILKVVSSGSERTDLFAKDAATWIIFPGGAGTLEEIGVGAEAKYFGTIDPKVPHPDKIILVDREFQKPLKDYMDGMQAKGLTRKLPYSEMNLVFDELFEQADTTDEILGKVENEKLSLIA